MSNRYNSSRHLDLSPDVYYKLVYIDPVWKTYTWSLSKPSLREAQSAKLKLIAEGASDIKIIQETTTYAEMQ